jgi:hypothetical protein
MERKVMFANAKLWQGRVSADEFLAPYLTEIASAS